MGGIGIFIESLHQIASGKVFVCGEYTVGIFTGNTHEFGKSGAGTDEYGFKAFVLNKFINGNGFADYHVGFNLNAEGTYIFDFLGNDCLFGKTEFGNTVNQNAACFVQGFKNRYIITHLCQISGTG